ncbi:MAG: glutathione S-transferase family protein, partial [Myxococcota bacterium]
MSVDLYHFPPSFYSQIARFALHEAGVAYRDRLVVNVSPFFDHYHPEFVRLNPEMTVPASRFGTEAVNGSMAIARRASQEGRSLLPDADAEVVESWIARYEGLPLGALTVGAFQKVDPSVAQAGHKRAAYLEAKLGGKVPVELRKHFERKLESLRADNERDEDPSSYTDAKARYGEALDALEAHLEDGREFIGGPSFSLADVVWAVTMARMIWLAEAPFDGRTNLESWYQRIKTRPAF